MRKSGGGVGDRVVPCQKLEDIVRCMDAENGILKGATIDCLRSSVGGRVVPVQERQNRGHELHRMIFRHVQQEGTNTAAVSLSVAISMQER